MSDKRRAKPVTITMLGGFSLTAGNTIITDADNRSLKLWGVLTYLIVHRDRNVSQAELIDQFWNEEGINPVNALKTLLFRIRAVLQPAFGPETEPILSHRGGYAWNQAIACRVDIDDFASLCQQAQETTRSAAERMDLYRRALALYQGDFLPKLSTQLWTIPLTASYHTRYLQAVRNFSALLEDAGIYDEMAAISARASQLDPLDEESYILNIRALLHLGNSTAALNRYETATDILYRTLGVRPSKELQDLYTGIMAMDHDLETNLSIIQDDLREVAARPGAFVCEYGFFKECYRLEARRTARTGVCVHVALLTVTLSNGSLPPPQVLGTVMDQLRDVLAGSLRQGDVVAKYSGSQYVILLHAANFENSEMVMERVVTAYHRKKRQNALTLTYKISALD